MLYLTTSHLSGPTYTPMLVPMSRCVPSIRIRLLPDIGPRLGTRELKLGVYIKNRAMCEMKENVNYHRIHSADRYACILCLTSNENNWEDSVVY